MITIGFLELNSIARGIEAADAMCKAAEVTLQTAKASCPGKYHILITGNVSAVESAMESGRETGGHHIIDEIIIPRVQDEVIDAIHMVTCPEHPGAVGILEYFSVASSIIGADAAVKSADVQIIEMRLGTGIGGKSFVTLTGDVSAVTSAVENGAQCVEDSGLLVSKTVIPHPDPQLLKTLY